MARRVRKRSGVVAVVLSLALHGLLGLGLLTQSSRTQAEVKPQSPATITAAALDDDEPFECQMYLVPDPPAKPQRREAKTTPAAPVVEPPQFVALTPNLPSADVVPQTPMFPPVPQNIPGAGVGQTASQGQSGMGSTFFGLPAPVQAKKIVYLLDRSGSMGKNSLLKRASRELLGSLEKLAPTAEFQILVYNSTVEPLPRPLLQWRSASAENRQQVALALEKLPAEGGTDHLPALRRAIGLRPDVIFLVTDADDLTEEQVRLTTELNAGKSVIHTIELNLANRQREFMPLQRLARGNGGRYQAVDLEKVEP